MFKRHPHLTFATRLLALIALMGSGFVVPQSCARAMGSKMATAAKQPAATCCCGVRTLPPECCCRRAEDTAPPFSSRVADSEPVIKAELGSHVLIAADSGGAFPLTDFLASRAPAHPSTRSMLARLCVWRI